MAGAHDLPVRPMGVCVHVVRPGNPSGEHLLLRRSGNDEAFPGIWQGVAGAIEPGETAWQTALRETREEAGVEVQRLYTANITQQFYAPAGDFVMVLPVFVAFVAADARGANSHEHDAIRWVRLEEAREMLAFPQQFETLRVVEEYFLRREPSDHLRIPISGEEARS